MKWFSAITWYVAMMTGCSQSVVLQIPPTETLNVIVSAKGSAPQKCDWSPDSDQAKKLSAWLAKNQTGWKATPASFAPGVQISGTHFTLNFLDKGAILNYDGGQYSHTTELSDIDFLVCP